MKLSYTLSLSLSHARTHSRTPTHTHTLPSNPHRRPTHSAIFLDIFSSRAWIFICWTSIVSALRRRIKRSWLPIHSARIVLLMRTCDELKTKSGDFLSMGLMMNLRLWKVMLRISDQGKPIFGVSLGDGRGGGRRLALGLCCSPDQSCWVFLKSFNSFPLINS